MALITRSLTFTRRSILELPAALALALTCSTAYAGPWSIAFSLQEGVPAGWVQVRENSIDGSRLGFRDDLGVNRVPVQEIAIRYQQDTDNYWLSALQNFVVKGTAVPASDVTFNGTTLQAGMPLSATTGFPDFLRVSFLRGHRLAVYANGAVLDGELGLSYVALTFHVSGTESPASVGHETKEDFVTQELPTPTFGLRMRWPLRHRLAMVSRVEIAYLPWVNSRRREGGDVRLQQRNTELDIGLRYEVTPDVAVAGEGYYRFFHQHERSTEDENNILLETHGLKLEVDYRF